MNELSNEFLCVMLLNSYNFSCSLDPRNFNFLLKQGWIYASHFKHAINFWRLVG